MRIGVNFYAKNRHKLSILFFYSYQSALELRQRMDPIQFHNTIEAMNGVASAIDMYFEYAKRQTEHSSSTSTFALVGQIVRRFYNDIILKDFEIAFG